MLERKRKVNYLLAALAMVTFLTACSLPGREAEILSLVGSEEAPTLDPDADRDPCLDGNWIMPTADLDLFVASMVPIPNMRVVGGSLNMSFGDGVYDYSGEFTLQIELDMSEGEYLQGDGVFTSGGAYATENVVTSREDFTVLTLDLTVSESEVIVWRAYKNGEVQTAAGVGPSFVILPPGSATYRCSPTLLEIDTQGAAGEVTMFFQR